MNTILAFIQKYWLWLLLGALAYWYFTKKPATTEGTASGTAGTAGVAGTPLKFKVPILGWDISWTV